MSEAPVSTPAFVLDTPSGADTDVSKQTRTPRISLSINPASLSPPSVYPPGAMLASPKSSPGMLSPFSQGTSPGSRHRSGSFLMTRKRSGSMLAPRGGRLRAGSMSQNTGGRQRSSTIGQGTPPLLINAGQPRDIFFVPSKFPPSMSSIPLVSSKSTHVDSLVVDENGKQQEQKTPDEDEQNFAEIVDIDDEEAHENFVSEDLLGKVLGSWQFRMFIILVIIVNSVLIGLQTDRNIEAQFVGAFAAVDSIILTIFVVEILLKWYHGFWVFWFVGWNVFDFFIVAISLLGPSVSFLSTGRVLRLLRVLRAFRTLRSISALQGLQIIVRTLLKSLPDVANIVLLLLILMYVFAVVGVSVFGELLPVHFGDVASNMYTLFILMTQDGWINVFSDLRDAGFYVPGTIYFMLFIFLGAFVFANVIVGVNVTNLQAAYSEIKKARKYRHRQLKAQKQGADKYIRSTIPAPSVGPEIWHNQVPMEVPDPDRAPLGCLERYLLVLSAMEDNLAEHVHLKEKLMSITDEVKDLNRSLRRPGLDEWSSESGEDSVYHDDEPRGDVLTEMIRRTADRQAQPTTSAMALSLQKRRAMFGVLQEEQTRTERARQWAAGDTDKRVSFGMTEGASHDDVRTVTEPPKSILRRGQTVLDPQTRLGRVFDRVRSRLHSSTSESDGVPMVTITTAPQPRGTSDPLRAAASPGRGMQRGTMEHMADTSSIRAVSFSLTRAMAAVNEEEIVAEYDRVMTEAKIDVKARRGMTMSVLPLPPDDSTRKHVSRSRSSGSVNLDLSTTIDGSPRRGTGRSVSPGGTRSLISHGMEMITMGVDVGPSMSPSPRVTTSDSRPVSQASSSEEIISR